MLHEGSAGSNTAADHVMELDQAIVALPPTFRRRLTVTVDGAGARHGLVTGPDMLASAKAAGTAAFPPDQQDDLRAAIRAGIAARRYLNPPRRHRSYPRLIKRARHNS
jgi:hypothetical protein